jgi:hypothetical protein
MDGSDLKRATAKANAKCRSLRFDRNDDVVDWALGVEKRVSPLRFAPVEMTSFWGVMENNAWVEMTSWEGAIGNEALKGLLAGSVPCSMILLRRGGWGSNLLSDSKCGCDDALESVF